MKINEDLLQRFMNHVIQCEGAYFLDDLNRTGIEFTDEEVTFLKELAKS